MRIEREPGGYLVGRVAMTAGDLLEIAQYVAANKKQLEKDAAEDLAYDRLQKIRIAGKADANSKTCNGFVIVESGNSYHYHVFRSGEEYAGSPKFIERWKWDGQVWRSF